MRRARPSVPVGRFPEVAPPESSECLLTGLLLCEKCGKRFLEASAKSGSIRMCSNSALGTGPRASRRSCSRRSSRAGLVDPTSRPSDTPARIGVLPTTEFALEPDPRGSSGWNSQYTEYEDQDRRCGVRGLVQHDRDSMAASAASVRSTSASKARTRATAMRLADAHPSWRSRL